MVINLDDRKFFYNRDLVLSPGQFFLTEMLTLDLFVLANIVVKSRSTYGENKQ